MYYKMKATSSCHTYVMRISAIILSLLILVFPCDIKGAEYVPVDQLAKSPVFPPRMRHTLRRPGHYNPRLRGMPQRPRDPNVGKWVSPPSEYLADSRAAARSGEYAGAVLLARADGAPPAAAAQTNAQGVKLFGTVEFGRPLSSLPGWLDVIKRNEASPIFQAERYFNKKTNWKTLRDQASGLTKMDQLRLVNKFWNTWPYREDQPNWGKPDYWEIPAEFLKKSGDCEDYAIVKYFTLKELGFDPRKMRLVILRDTVRNLPHAVLAVYLDGDAYILDNLSSAVLSHKRMGNYSPQYSVNEFGRWAHIKSKGKSRR